MSKKALVISGGGSKGAFAVGVLKSLAADFPSIEFDILVGTSTGSLIVPMASTGQLSLLEKLYTTITTDNVIIKGNIIDRLTNHSSFFDATPLWQQIQQYYTDAVCQSIYQSDKTVFIATTCLQTMQSVNFCTKAVNFQSDYVINPIQTPDQLRSAVMASACQPALMPCIEVIKGAVPLRQYVDGGVREYAGIQMAIDAGADEIYAILLTPAGEAVVETNYERTFPILLRTLGIFMQDTGTNNLRIPMIYNKALRYIADVQTKMQQAGIAAADIEKYFDIASNPLSGKKALKIYVIRPLTDLDGGDQGLEFVPERMKEMLALGESRLKDYMANLPPEGDLLV